MGCAPADRGPTERGKHRQRIDACAVDPDSPVEMWTGHAARRAHLSDRLASGDVVAVNSTTSPGRIDRAAVAI